MSEQEFNDGDLMPWQDMTAKIKELEGIIKTYFDESPSKRIAELKARVDSLTRSLDFLQEVIGIEVVVTPGDNNLDQKMKEWSLSRELKQQKSTHLGQCELCARVTQLNDGNICEACFLEELYNEANLAL